MDREPKVGMTVFYHSFGTPGGEYPSVPRAAIVTEAYGKHRYTGLAVLNPTGLFFNTAVPYSEKPKPGHWTFTEEGP
jgi:hypothetical protein